MIPPDDAVALQLARDLDETEWRMRRELLSRCARRLHLAAVDADVAAVRRVWAALSALTEELADDPAAAEIVDAAAEYTVAAQANERGLARLAELGVTLHSEI